MKQLEKYLSDPAGFPFSFSYEGKEIKGFGEGFTGISHRRDDDADGTVFTVGFLHKDSGAVFEVRARSYSAYDAWEWTVYITNASDRATGLISDIRADVAFEGGSPVLSGLCGDLGDMYSPYEIDLTKENFVRTSTSGRPTHGVFPYFDLCFGNNSVFIAVGWPGCWKASFEGGEDVTRFTAGQLSFSARLLPNETVRTPLFAFLCCEGRDATENLNLWRRWFIGCNMRKDTHGKVIRPALGWGSIVQGMSTGMLERVAKAYIDHGVPLDYLWLDAGWYTDETGGTCEWPKTGTWRVNTEMFPDKFAAVSDLMHENGGKTLLWFESEVMRCNKEGFLAANPDFRPEWFLGTAAGGSWLEGQLLDLGDPGLRKWLLGRIFTVLDEGGIDMYRQDFNVDPAPVWSARDGTDRVGVTENRYVQGYLALWDAILERYPDMTIDSCASGGGRNDLETMRRAVPLHISDFWDCITGGYDDRQAIMLSLLPWFPYFKLQVKDNEQITEYRLRSCMAPWMNVNVPTADPGTPWELVRKACGEWKRLSELFYADFYPLTAFSKSDDVWRGWQFYDPETGRGAALVFRAEKSETDSMTLKLHAQPGTDYKVEDCDGKIDRVVPGAELSREGLEIKLENPGSSALIFMRRAD